MKPIYLREDFDDGYIDVTYENHDYGFWRQFRPDRRKLKMNRAKFTWKEGGFGSPASLHETGSMLCGVVNQEARAYYVRRHLIVKRLLCEAKRRYNQRYAKFGELGNSRMPPDPDIQYMLERINELFVVEHYIYGQHYMTSRRSFFATLLAPVVAYFTSKPTTTLTPALLTMSKIEYRHGKMGEHHTFQWNHSPQVATTLEWDVANGIFTRYAYDKDGEKIMLEQHCFDRIPFYPVQRVDHAVFVSSD